MFLLLLGGTLIYPFDVFAQGRVYNEIPTDKRQFDGKYILFNIDEETINIRFKPTDDFKTAFTSPNAFSLPLYQPFLLIAKDKPKVRYKHGSFRFKERPHQRCQKLKLQDVSFEKDLITLKGELCGNRFSMYFSSTEPGRLDIKVQLKDTTFNRLTLVYESRPKEQVYGMGEQFSHVNIRGHRIPVWVEEQGIGKGDQPITGLANARMAGGSPYSTAAPIPFYISTDKKAFLLHNSVRSVFDFRYSETIDLEVWNHELSASIWQADTPLQLIEKYTAETGRLPELPDWAYGAILGVQGGSEIVLSRLDSLLETGAPISAIWIQDWCGKRETPFGSQLNWQWIPDESRYPDFNNFCANLKEKNIAVLGYINPFLASDSELYKIAKRNEYLIKKPEGGVYLVSSPGMEMGMIDLTNPAAFDWLKKIIKENMIDKGLSGWMADYGEWLPWDAVLFSGESARSYHNRYVVDWARLNREAIQESGREGKLAFFSRAGFTEANKYATFYWASDQITSWQLNDGLPSIVPGLLSSGIGGMSINHADIGGFTSFIRGPVKFLRDEELLKRHIELAAFTPVFRTHESVLPDDNVQVYDTPEMRNFYARFAIVHDKLKNYLKAYAKESTEKGYPMIRHLYLHYPNDESVLNIQDQFLLGKDILVTPVVKKGAINTDVYLPEGNWRHLFTGEIYKGGLKYQINSPIGTPPAFINTESKWADKFSGF